MMPQPRGRDHREPQEEPDTARSEVEDEARCQREREARPEVRARRRSPEARHAPETTSSPCSWPRWPAPTASAPPGGRCCRPGLTVESTSMPPCRCAVSETPQIPLRHPPPRSRWEHPDRLKPGTEPTSPRNNRRGWTRPPATAAPAIHLTRFLTYRRQSARATAC